jgi:hypothetical protein
MRSFLGDLRPSLASTRGIFDSFIAQETVTIVDEDKIEDW